MEKAILFFCSFISCFIIVNILFQFLNVKYKKVFDNQIIYIGLPLLAVFFLGLINMFMNPLVNLGAYIILFAIISYFFYFEDNGKRLRVIEAETLFIVIIVIEALGVYLADLLLAALHIVPESVEINLSIETTLSKIVLLFFYYTVVNRFWLCKPFYSKAQAILYPIMFAYSIINVIAISLISDKEKTALLLVNTGCIIFANLYLLYFIRFLDERNFYKMQVLMREQQEKLLYENYEVQQQKYKESIAILHDVSKHIKTIESLYRNKFEEKAILYTKEINTMLVPLIPIQYTNNLIFNCMIADKLKAAEIMGINFEINILIADINFMKSVDITTLFGNLLDNALTASSKCSERKYVYLIMKDYNEIISIRIENNFCGQIQIKNGMIVNTKSGVGISNIKHIVDKYGGSIIYKNIKSSLVCDIILNRTESKF